MEFKLRFLLKRGIKSNPVTTAIKLRNVRITTEQPEQPEVYYKQIVKSLYSLVAPVALWLNFLNLMAVGTPLLLSI